MKDNAAARSFHLRLHPRRHRHLGAYSDRLVGCKTDRPTERETVHADQIELPTFTDPDLSPEEFSAQWGADPVYMHAPNLPGDGYLFYNFSVEQDDPDFLRQFVPAIERTIQFVEQNPNRFPPKNEDAADLQEFLEYVKAL